MTRCPTTLLSQVCATPSAPVVIDTAIMPATSSVSSALSCCGIASSRMRRSRNGEIREMIALRAISASTTNNRLRYGLKSRAMRRGLLMRYLIVVSMIEVLNYLACTTQGRGEERPRLRRVQPAIPGAPRWARAAADGRAADQAGELQAAEAIGARDMERTRHIERR